MTKQKENKDALISFRVREGLKTKLEELAAKDFRDLSNYITVILERHIAEIDNK